MPAIHPVFPGHNLTAYHGVLRLEGVGHKHGLVGLERPTKHHQYTIVLGRDLYMQGRIDQG